MNNTFKITADVDTNSAETPLGLEVWLDNSQIHNIDPVSGPASLSVYVDDDTEQEHELKFVLKNKTTGHTKVDEVGNILYDAVVEVKNLKFDEIELGHMFYEQAVYRHDFNGNGPATEEKFYGTMGCNGTASLKFTTPMYLWLLENM